MSSLVGASSVGVATAVAGLLLLALVIAVGIWAIRVQRRQFPKDFDRTGWSPKPGNSGWFRTKFTWLSGGRG